MIQRTEQDIMQNWQTQELPIVSICCVTYNHENYISEAIEGFLIQETDFPFEIIIRDDCSTDITAEIVKSYADKYPNLIKPIFETENQFSEGVRPMPVVMNASVGKYIALCDGDDYWTDPLKIQKQYDFLSKNDDYAICYSSSTVINDKGEVLIQNKNFGDSTQNMLIAGRGYAITSTVMFKRFDWYDWQDAETSNGDVYLWHCLGLVGHCKFLEDIKNSVYRVHENGFWSGRGNKNKLDCLIATHEVIKRSIEEKLMNNEEILKSHNEFYYILINDFLKKSIFDMRVSDYFYGIKKALFLKGVNSIKFIVNHVIKIVIFCSKNLKLKAGNCISN